MGSDLRLNGHIYLTSINARARDEVVRVFLTKDFLDGATKQ